MIFVGLVVVTLIIAALFGGLCHAVGSVAIALMKYVVAPVAILIAFLCLLKASF